MLDILLEHNTLHVSEYTICLVQNNRVVEVWKNNEKIFSKPASWAVLWTVGEMTGISF